MWKFKASKFKNAAPRVPKKEEWVTDVAASNLLQSCGSHIQSSAVYTAFNTDAGGGGSLGVLPLTTRGRQPPGSIPHIRAHAEFVTDFKFNPFNDFLLATTAHDGMVKIWELPETDDISSAMIQPQVTLTQTESHIDLVTWHPTVQSILATAAHKQLTLFDVESQQHITEMEPHESDVHSVSWRGDGSVLVTSCKDKKLRILDPRANKAIMEVDGHANMRDSQVQWLGNKDTILSTGYDSMRSREASIRDCRNLSSALCTKSYDTASGVLIPLYDEDTGMLFLGGKGDTTLRYLEVINQDLIENSSDSVEQIKGLCLVPKRAMDVMQCEVNRVLVLGRQALVPLPYHVPRKSYREFHGDLFPDTASGTPALTSAQWRDGQTELVCTTSLDPVTNPKVIVRGGSTPTPAGDAPRTSNTAESQAPVKTPVKPSVAQIDPPQVAPPAAAAEAPYVAETEPVKPSDLLRDKKSTFTGVRQSKFRHVQGTPDHKGRNIENIRNLSKSVPGESDMFYANSKFCAFPLGGSGGLVAVLKIDDAGRLPDTGIPALQNGSAVMDVAWDPFDDHTLAVACDDAKVRLWKIPEEGLTTTLTEPHGYLHGHTEKLYFVKYHPLAAGVLATGSYDMTVRIWDVSAEEEKIGLKGHTDTIFCLTWSPDGQTCATVCKDGLIRIYNPRESDTPIKEGSGPAGPRGARLVWACNGSILIVTGFNRSSERQVSVYDVDNLNTPVHVENMDTSPGLLIPHYDEDSSTVFLTGRGERTVRAFEVVAESPYIFPLSNYRADGLHQALAFLPKKHCDVSKVEFARALRLTQHSVEPLAFTIPRVKTEYFQDDLYPETKVTWEAVCSAAEWFSGVDKPQRTISLRPQNMKLLSEAPIDAPKPKKYESYNPDSYKTEDQKKEELLGAMRGKFEISDKPLPQDLTEGVDDDEWDDY